ncbi:MAG TPA: single-stranded DNA-binding protein [Eubacteriales bacterium]|jgi:single-strand DNA-binding protein|nr:single-stranded DNA-binding protein [Clostridia bacterium]HRR89197.1 single-stranded DNA-binding protein [Eubacteriales bacterium]HRU83783.1 single-stranded DNA-binding protein [Eubacteriales bacterium]
MNKVILIGNLTKNPELTKTSNDIYLCKFTLAVSRKYSRDGNRETDFLPVVVWRGQAENCGKYLKKGSRAAVFGSIQTRSYEDNNGIRRYVTEIAADEVQFLSTKSEGEQQDEVFDDAMKAVDDDLPF